MQPHCKRENQFELFESAAVEPTPKLALPFQRSAEIDVKRLATILGVCALTARKMAYKGHFRYYGSKRILVEYQSVVEFCDKLRVVYQISGHAAPRPKAGRVRDRDLLPFPLSETMTVKEVTERLDCSIRAVINRIEEGVLVAYKATLKGPGSAWRIYQQSFDRYTESLRATAVRQSLRSASSRR